MKDKKVLDWFIRFLKGSLMGSGAILPGVSGGALAAIFGLYERLISFLSNITKNFIKNFRYFLPVVLGGIFGIFILSFALSFLFETSENQLVWFFIGAIVGVFPALVKQAAKKGREKKHIVITIFTTIIAFDLLYMLKVLDFAQVPQNVYTWTLAGGIFALGLIVPGLSPSNFLVYMGMYESMTAGIKNLDFTIIIPLLLGAVITVLAFSHLMNYIFKKAYAGMFHIILGVVIASSLMIIPFNYNYFSIGGLFCLLALVLGIGLGAWMSKLEEEYKPEGEDE